MTAHPVTTRRDRILVGVDESAGSVAALAWAAAEAAVRNVPLDVAHAWSMPAAEGWNPEWPADEVFYRRHALELCQRMIADHVGAGVAATAVEIECEVPAFGLLDRAKDAALLVVGTRGAGALSELLLGSVSRQCVHNASGPVVVVPVPPTH